MFPFKEIVSPDIVWQYLNFHHYPDLFIQGIQWLNLKGRTSHLITKTYPHFFWNTRVSFLHRVDQIVIEKDKGIFKLPPNTQEMIRNPSISYKTFFFFSIVDIIYFSISQRIRFLTTLNFV